MNWLLFRIIGTIFVVLFCVIGAFIFTFICFAFIAWIQQEMRMKREAKTPARREKPVDDYAEMHASLLRHLDEVRRKL